jgi:integrase
MMGTRMNAPVRRKKSDIPELTALSVSRLKEPGLHLVGGIPGLALQITQTGARSWILRVMIAGKRRDMGLGGYPGVTLASAREAAREARAKIKSGIDPIEENRARNSALAAARASALTFEQCAVAFVAAKEPEWKNAKHAAQWRTTLATYCYPLIGKILVRDVSLPHVKQILEPLWTSKTETATRLRSRIEGVIDYAIANGYRAPGDNPARWRGHLDKLLPKPSKVAKVKHHSALPYSEIGTFMAELRKQSGMGARALEFAILTAARSGEARGATWAEIDLNSAVWTIPASRMKAGEEHRVPLPDAAIRLLRDLPRIDGSDLVFTNTKGTMLSDMTLSAVLKRMGRHFTVHGFRSSFRDWCGEKTSHPREIVEFALAHKLPDQTEAAYFRGTAFDKRRRLMTDWARYCDTVLHTGTVTPIAGTTAA